MLLRIEAREKRWPLAELFRISRGAKTEAHVVEVTVAAGEWTGRGEGVPYGRYGETMPEVLATISNLAKDVAAGGDADELIASLPVGAARNALDCAMWDLRAKREGTPVWRLLGLTAPAPVTTTFTLSVDTPEAMHAKAKAHSHRPILKLKLAGDGADLERVSAVHEGARAARIWVDANEGLDARKYERLAEPFAARGVVLIEQPLPSGHDAALRQHRPVSVCADESFRGGADKLDGLLDRYDAINIKLDKSGGLSEAMRIVARAEELGVQIAVGCMCSTSLSLAPAVLLAARAHYVDLDAGLLLAKDREPGLHYEGITVHPPAARLWGGAPEATSTSQS